MNEPLDSREVRFGETTFRIGKLLPIEAKRVFMRHVRPLLRGALSAEVPENGDGSVGWQVLLAAFTDAPNEHYEAIVHSLYQNITYTGPSVTAPTCLLGDEENAFRDLDMAHALILEGRAFYVNFFASWTVILSEFPSLNRVFQSSKLGT